MNGTMVTADVKFLRRVLMALVVLTVATGAVAGFTAVHVVNAQAAELSNP